jgi:uncharacterized protein YjbI with pentapeptide repeats
MNKEELNEVLAKHKLWLESEGAEGEQADFSDAYLYRADLSYAILEGANLSDAYLYRADLSYANLSRVDLSHANLSRATLSYANLSNAILEGVNLSHADLSRVDLSHVNLSHVNLSRANLSRAILEGVNLEGVNLWECRGNGQEITSLDLGTWLCTLWKDQLQIGCQRHSLEQWAAFSDQEINAMDGRAMVWWTENRNQILAWAQDQQGQVL